MHIDPALFRPEAISEETAAFNSQLRATLEAAPSITTMEPQTIRDLRREGIGIWGQLVFSDLAEDRTIPGPAGEIPVRVIAGDTVDAVYLHIHGGGWVLGSHDAHDPAHEAIARAAGVAVVSVGYRLAPESPYPAGADDCEAAAAWLVDHALDEFGTEKLVIGGESAGAHLAVVTLLRMRDHYSYTGFRGANLVYGKYTLDHLPSTHNWDRGNLILDLDVIPWFHDHTFAPSIDPKDPDASPLYADLRGMPHALFTVGTFDPLLDDTLLMAARWEVAGNETELAVFPGGIHAFDAFPDQLAIAREARTGMHSWLRDRVTAIDATT